MDVNREHPISLGGTELPYPAALILRCGEHHIKQMVDEGNERGGISLTLRPHGANELSFGSTSLKLRTVAERPEMDAVLRMSEGGKLERIAPVCGTMTVRDGGAAAARRPSKAASAAPPASKKRAVAVSSNIDRMAKPSGKVTTAAPERRGRTRVSREQGAASAPRRSGRGAGPSDVPRDYVSPLIPEMRRRLVHALAVRDRPLGELLRIASRGHPATPHTQRGAQEAIRLVATMEPTSLYRLRERSWPEVDPEGWGEYGDEERASVQASQQTALKRAAEAGTTLKPIPTPQATETVEEALRHVPTAERPDASAAALDSLPAPAAGTGRRDKGAAAQPAASSSSRQRRARLDAGPAAKRARPHTSAGPGPLLGESERRRYSRMQREAIAEAAAHVDPVSPSTCRAQRARFAQLYPSYIRIDRILNEGKEALEAQCAELDEAQARSEAAEAAAASGEGQEGEDGDVEALTHIRYLRRERALRQELEEAFEAQQGDIELLHGTYGALHVLLGKIKAGVRAYTAEEEGEGVEEEEDE